MHLEVKGLSNDTTTTQGGTQPNSEDTADSGTTIRRKKPGACSVNLVGRRGVGRRVWWGDRVEGKRRRGQRMSRRKERKLTVSEGF